VRSEVVCISHWQPLHFEEIEEGEVIDNTMDAVLDDEERVDEIIRHLRGVTSLMSVSRLAE